MTQSSRTILQRPRFELFSPYDAALTAELETVLADEVRRVQDLFADREPQPLKIYLRAVEFGEQSERQDLLWRYRPTLDGLRGATVDGRFVVVFLPAADAHDPGAVSRALALNLDVVRHELVHLCLYRMGVRPRLWLHEGLAHDVESMRVAGDGRLDPDPLPLAFLITRRESQPPKLAELLAASDEEIRHSEVSAALRFRMQALARFLMQRSGGQTWRASLERVVALPAAEIRALDAQFQVWLRALDPLARVRELIRSADPRERELGAGLLSSYSEHDPLSMGTGEADTLSLEIIEDPACKADVSRYLIFFAARRLTAAALERLEASGDRVQLLTALAIRTRRGEGVDLERARAVEAALTPEERSQATFALHFVFGASAGA